MRAENILRVSAVAVIGVIIWLLWVGYRDVYQIYGQVRPGMYEYEVVHLIGEPTRRQAVQIETDYLGLPPRSDVLIWSRPCGDVCVFVDNRGKVRGKSVGLKPGWTDGSSSLFSSKKDYER